MTEDEKRHMLAQPAAEHRFLLERMPAAIVRAVEEGRPARAEQPAAGAGDWLSGVRLLVVDDDADVREIAHEMLTEMGASVTGAEGAAAALLHLRTGADIDLVLADLTMPHVNGLELAREIALLLPQMPVVLMTGYGASAMEDSGSNIRATLQKPFRADTLGKVLAGVLGRVATHV